MTFDEGRTRTWRLPRRSALTMLFCMMISTFSIYMKLRTHQAVVENGDADHGGQARRAGGGLWRHKGGMSTLEYARPSVVLQKARVKTS